MYAKYPLCICTASTSTGERGELVKKAEVLDVEKVEFTEITLPKEQTINMLKEITAPPTPKKPRKANKNGKPKTVKKGKVNPILDKASFNGKLEATLTNQKIALETEIMRIGIATIKQLCKEGGDDEGMDMINMGKWHIVPNLSTTGSRKGNTDADSTTKGYYCPSTSTGQWVVDGMVGKELTINYWNLHKMGAEEFFNFVVHEFVHAYSDLSAKTDKDRDCAKNGAHKKRFADLCAQVDWIEAIPASGYVKMTSQITDEGRKMVKKLKVKAPSIGKTPAPKKPKAKRVSLECKNCDLKVMVPFGKWEKGKVTLNCLCLGKENGVEMKANVIG